MQLTLCHAFASLSVRKPALQDAMYDYLKERNIDDDLAAFICMYADQKEQNEYTNWLEEMSNFVK